MPPLAVAARMELLPVRRPMPTGDVAASLVRLAVGGTQNRDWLKFRLVDGSLLLSR